MRTTLDIEDDILQAVKKLAQRESTTAGKVISALARRGLARPGGKTRRGRVSKSSVPLLPLRGEVITLEHVQDIMDREGL